MSAPRLDPAAWRRAEPILDELLELEPAARTARLRLLEATDPALATEVRALLAAAETEELLSRPAAEMAALLGAADDVRSRVGERLGPFRITSELGRGGMGAVYAAERVDGGFQQQVAVKVIKRGMDSEQVVRRFLAERQILARLDHPHIAHLIDGGVTDDGLPWFALERVQGRPITEEAERPLRERLSFFLDVCAAVEFAHGHRVVHRDIKPSNVLVSATGEVKLLDFGIAKLLDPSEERLTRTDMLVMTPLYAAPEQHRGAEITTATDVWQLGRLLEAVIGSPWPRDLQRIVARACHDEPVRRYASAEALADDLRRFLDGRPVLARGDSPVYRLGRFVRSHRAATALGGLALVVIAGFWFSRRQPAGFLEASVRQVTHNSSENSLDSGAISPDGKYLAYADRTGLHLRLNQTGETRTVPAPEGLENTRTVWNLAPGWFPDSTRFVANLRSDDQDTARGSSIWIVSLQGAPQKLLEQARAFSVSPDGSWIAFGRNGSQWGDREVWRMAPDGKRSEKLYEAETGSLTNVAWSPDGRRTAYVKVDEFGAFLAIETRDFAGGSPTPVLKVPETEMLLGFVWLRDGRLLYSVRPAAVPNSGTACTHWQVHLDPSTARPVGAPLRVATWLPQCVGPFTVTADIRHAAFRQWATQDVVYIAGLDPTGTEVSAPRRFTHREGRNIPSGFSPDGKSLVFVSDAGGAARLLRQPIDSDAAEMLANEPRISGAARLSPDGASVFYVVIGKGRDPTATHKLMRVPLAGGRAQEVLTGRLVDGGARCAVAPATLCAVAERSSDSRQLVFTAFDPAKGRGRELARFDCDPSGDYRWGLAPDGTRLAVLNSQGNRIHVLSLAGQPPYALDVKDWSSLGYVSWTADGRRLLVSSRKKRSTPLLSVNLQGGAQILWEQDGSIDTSALASPDGRHLAIWIRATSANIWMADLP